MVKFKGHIEFTPAERDAHSAHVATIMETARKYLEDTWKEHIAFHRKHGVSKFYGDRHPSLNTREKRVAALRSAGADPSLVDELKPTSCIGLTMNALQAGFTATKDHLLAAVWKRVFAFVKDNGMDGSALLDALQKLDWMILYWNPNPRENARWDSEDGTRKSRGWHAERHKQVTTKGSYYSNTVNDRETLVGFGSQSPAALRHVPFFIGVAHTGYHVFPGFRGDVIEAHSMRALDSIDNLEKSPFNPLAKGGGPRWTATEKYRSGIIGVPPAKATKA